VFVIGDHGGKPIKIWLAEVGAIDDGCLAQAKNLSHLPFLFRHVALMPDTHEGYGMPIGGVIATQDVIIPNAVGVDIGCGMAYTATNLITKDFSKHLPEIVNKIMARIPVGFNHHKSMQMCESISNVVFDGYFPGGINSPSATELRPELQRGLYQLGTLGGGNHFIEIQADTKHDTISIMVHSGSRNFGLKIAKYFNNIAKGLNKKWYTSIPTEHDLAFLPVSSSEGEAYLWWMNLALKFAEESRAQMLQNIKNIVSEYTNFPEFHDNCDVHHNYASLEHHFGRDVWVHRKGAIRAHEGEIGIIPGSMGSFSYIVRGKGERESFQSSSHGAGRLMSRKKAKEMFAADWVMDSLTERGIIVGVPDQTTVGDECSSAYKDIKYVIQEEADLTEVVNELRTLAVIKG
jgi:tRNA-splicing ligase RtcB